jgi:hypothetical protein
MLEKERAAMIDHLDTLLDGTLSKHQRAELAAARDEKRFRNAASRILVEKKAAVLVDWRSPADEVLEDVDVLFRDEGADVRARLTAPVPEDLSAEQCLAVIAGRVAGACRWRLGWIDQESDSFLTVRVWNATKLAPAVDRINLGNLKVFKPAAPRASPRLGDGASDLTPGPTMDSQKSGSTYRSWRDLVDGIHAWNDHGALVLVAQDAKVRAIVAAHSKLVPRAIAGTLDSLLALLDGRELSGPLTQRLEAIRYFSLNSSSLKETLSLLALTAPEVTKPADVRRYLLASKLSAFPDKAAAAAAELPADAAAAISAVVRRGLKSAEPTVLCAALESAGVLGLSALRDAVAAHRSSPNDLVRQSASAALRSLASASSSS